MTKGDKIKLRAELAGKAMQGLLSNPGGPVQRSEMTGWSSPINCTHDDVAREALFYADALMAELGIKGEE